MLLAVFSGLVLVRLPVVATEGRFWAEEGALYFRNALVLPWWQALVRPEHGYLSLYANIAGLLAHYCVPLADAPLVTTGLALLAQCLPALVLLTSSDRWLRPAPVITGAVLLIAMAPLCDEVWLNTANSQFHVALAAALCVAFDVPAGIGSLARKALLLLAALCSPITIALIPVVALRAILERHRERTLQAACLVAGAVPQLAFMVLVPLPERGKLLGPVTMACIVAARHLVGPFLGEDAAHHIVPAWFLAAQSGHVPRMAMAMFLIVAVIVVAAVVLGRRAAGFYLLLSGIALALVSYNSAVGGGINLITVDGSQRYAFAPSMLFALSAVALCSVRNIWVAHAAKIVFVWLLTVSVWQTIRPQDTVYAQGPAWRAELERWRVDPRYAPKIWPDGWSVAMPRDK